MNEFLYNLKDYRLKKQKLFEFYQNKMKVEHNNAKSKSSLFLVKLCPILDKEEFAKDKKRVNRGKINIK
jgi:hypothetical protein